MSSLFPFMAPGGGPNPYVAEAIEFDGSNDYLTRGADLTGNANSKVGTVNLWTKIDNDSVDAYLSCNANEYFRIRRVADNRLFINCENTSGSNIVIFASTTTYGSASGWIHILASWDLSVPTGAMYIDDVLEATGTLTDDTIDWTRTNFLVGASTTPNRYLSGDAADYMLWTNGYIDLTIEANRRKFIDGDGKPVDPDKVNGAVDILGTPILRLTNPLATWHENAGSGGNLTVNGGGLAAAATSPSD